MIFADMAYGKKYIIVIVSLYIFSFAPISKRIYLYRLVTVSIRKVDKYINA